MKIVLYSVVITVVVCILTRWSISLGHYSGEGRAPMFGDYEAQRHWMEITANLPISEWYANSTKNDLQYWGLDYPPLTAYHSYICGKIAHWFNDQWVELATSHGFESLNHKLFMRATVLVVDVLIYFPAIICFVFLHTTVSNSYKVLLCATSLLYPGLMLIDHGHFQYNCVSLGLFVWAVVALARHRELIATALFCLALNYKQMELYHALPFFCYLMGLTLRMKRGWKLIRLFKLAFVVVATFAVCWFPFIHNQETAFQVLQRLFPFERGLYEDKVANIWCSLSLLIKFKDVLPTRLLLKFCLLSTLITLLPSSLDLLFSPSFKKFKVALLNSSLIFFLLSFQVHEKSILLPAVAACLLLDESPLMCLWFLVLSTFSMLPLLCKDGLTAAFCASTMIFIVLSLSFHQPFSQPYFKKHTKLARVVYAMVGVSLAGCLSLTVTSITVLAPLHLPDIHAVLASAYSCGHFVIFLVYFHYLQFTIHTTGVSTPKHTHSTGASKKAR